MRLFIISCSLEINQTSSDAVRPSNSLVGSFLLSAEVFSNWLRFFNSLPVVRCFLVCAEAFGNFSFVSFLIGERHHYYSITVGRFKLKIKLYILAPLHLRLPVREGSSNNDDKSELGQEVF